MKKNLNNDRKKSFQVKFIEGTKDTDLGVEVITFDDPVNTVPSANLVSGEYLSSSNDAQNNVVPVVIRNL